MKRVLVTGAAGFVGANLTRHLLQGGHDLHLLVRPGSDPWRLKGLLPHVQLHEVDLTDEEKVSNIVKRAKPDWVFHLAAYGAYSWQTELGRMARTNIIGTMNLVESCLRTGLEAFVNTGSSSEYGFKDHAPSEAERLEPNSHYAVTKASATLFCRYAAQRYQVLIQTLRLYSVYGPYEESNRLMPTLIMCGLNGKLPPLVNPNVARDYVYVEDVNEAYLLAATCSGQEPGAIYNVGTGVQTLLRDVADVARRVLGVTAEPEWGSMPKRQWDTDVWVSDNRKIQRELGWRPRYSLEQGFRQMVSWFRDNPHLHRQYSGYSPSVKAP